MLRPIDELPDDAVVTVQANAAMFWLRDAAGVDYRPPGWLDGLIRTCWDNGYAQCQADLRELLEPEEEAGEPVAAGEAVANG